MQSRPHSGRQRLAQPKRDGYRRPQCRTDFSSLHHISVEVQHVVSPVGDAVRLRIAEAGKATQGAALSGIDRTVRMGAASTFSHKPGPFLSGKLVDVKVRLFVSECKPAFDSPVLRFCVGSWAGLACAGPTAS